MRRKVIFFMALASFVFIASGCIDSTTVISINEDGSGKIIETFGMNKEMAASMKSMMSMGQGFETEDTSQSVFKKEDFQKKVRDFGEDVKLESFETFEDKNFEYAKCVYSFDDINKIRIKQGGEGSSPGATPDTEKEARYITFRFTKDNNISNLKINMPKGKKEPSDVEEERGVQPPPSPDELGAMKKMFKGLHFAAKVQVNGKITQTNATYISENTITLFDVDFDKFLDNDEILMELQKFENPQDAQEVFQSIKGIKVEPNEQINISFIPHAEAGVVLPVDEDFSEPIKLPLSEDSAGEGVFGDRFLAGFFTLGIGFMLIILAIILVPAIITIWLFCRIFRKTGYPAALGILMIFPFINLIMLMILAFLDWPVYKKFASAIDIEPDENLPLNKEPEVIPDKPGLIKKKEDEGRESDKPVLSLPSEADTPEWMPKKDEEKKSKSEEEPKIILDNKRLSSQEEDIKEESEEEEKKDKDSTPDA